MAATGPLMQCVALLRFRLAPVLGWAIPDVDDRGPRAPVACEDAGRQP